MRGATWRIGHAVQSTLRAALRGAQSRMVNSAATPRGAGRTDAVPQSNSAPSGSSISSASIGASMSAASSTRDDSARAGGGSSSRPTLRRNSDLEPGVNATSRLRWRRTARQRPPNNPRRNIHPDIPNSAADGWTPVTSTGHNDAMSTADCLKPPKLPYPDQPSASRVQSRPPRNAGYATPRPPEYTRPG